MRRRHDGFTLIETLLALAILAGAAATLLAIRANAVRNATTARNRQIATMLLSEELAQLALNPAASLQMTRQFNDHPGFTCRTILTQTPLGALGLGRRVRIEMRFPAGGMSSDGYDVLAVETLLAPGGGQ